MTKYEKGAPESIQALFNSIAREYDRTNAVLSLQLHRWWNRQLVKGLLLRTTPHQYLDLCCGTGEIARLLLEHTPIPCQATLLDFSEKMLECAQHKLLNRNFRQSHSLNYLHADAQEIPLPPDSCDGATIAYGIRNVKDPLKCFREIHRTLRPGGWLGILELTRPNHPLLQLGHKLYLKTCVPLLGKWCTANSAAYHYLCDSVQHFSHPQELSLQLAQAGFEDRTIHSLAGGIATILFARKSPQTHSADKSCPN